jgi:hypothetical protein
MSQPRNGQKQAATGTARDRFPKPRTFPTKWADSEDYAEGSEGAKPESGALARGAQTNPVSLEGEAESQASFDKQMESFPQPRTFPKRWRLNGTE